MSGDKGKAKAKGKSKKKGKGKGKGKGNGKGKGKVAPRSSRNNNRAKSSNESGSSSTAARKKGKKKKRAKKKPVVVKTEGSASASAGAGAGASGSDVNGVVNANSPPNKKLTPFDLPRDLFIKLVQMLNAPGCGPQTVRSTFAAHICECTGACRCNNAGTLEAKYNAILTSPQAQNLMLDKITDKVLCTLARFNPRTPDDLDRHAYFLLTTYIFFSLDQ